MRIIVAISKENEEKTRLTMQEHKRKIESDPKYREKMEKLRKLFEEKLFMIEHED